jgi:hypothetical protein
MATLDGTPTDSAATTTARYRQAAEAGDVEGLIATLAPNVVFHSPITDRAAFHGHDEMRELVECVFDTITGIDFFADVGEGRTRALFFRGFVGRTPVEEALRVELDDHDLIVDLSASFRPLPALTTIAATLVPKVIARRRGHIAGAIVKFAMTPIMVLTRLGDRAVPLLA